MSNRKQKSLDFSQFKNDFPAAIVVWLVALPLCLGIAQGSKPVPETLPDGSLQVIEGLDMMTPFVGIIAGIIGGILVTFFSGSKFGVSGPAAGLITIVVAGIATLGYPGFTAALVIAGIMQFLMGLFRLGVVGYFVPTSVINGMLASIGITLILKQIPHAFGVDKDFFGDLAFSQKDGENTFSEIGHIFDHIEMGGLIIFGLGMLLMIVWDLPFMKRMKWTQFLPGSLLVVVIGALLNTLFINMGQTDLALGGNHLVDLPDALQTGEYGSLFVFPDFSLDILKNKDVYIFAITLALVGSIETLLSVEATDKLDPDKNISPTNKELKAQGIGNFFSGLIGGLPITMVIVRSSANINARAKTKLSAIYHGILLLISVFLFPSLLELIPLSALAAILIMLGWKLVKIKKVFQMLKTDKVGFAVLVVTIVAVLATDLLRGVGIGFAFSMFFILRKNYVLAFIKHWDEKKKEMTISFSQIVSFLNKGALMQTLQELPDGASLKISAKRCHTMSKEIKEVIHDFIDFTSDKHNIKVTLIGFDKFGFEHKKVEKLKEGEIKADVVRDEQIEESSSDT